MGKYLFIAEKPSLMRDIQTAYNSLSSKPYQADFVALRGHFMELQEPDSYKPEWGKPWSKDVLPMIPDTFIYNPKSSVKADYSKLKPRILSSDYDYIVNACDAGREGEAIFWTLYNHVKCKTPVKRLWAQDTTIETLSKALTSLLNYSSEETLTNLRESSLRRIEFDWLVGMNLSRAAMLTTNKKISVGRVKTPTLNIIVTRDLEIANFKPKDYFEIEADYDKFKGMWFKDKISSFENKSDAENLISKLGKTGTIKEVKEEKVVTYAPALYSLAELQKEANRVYGFTAGETLEIAQSLYEKHKILSYPRTESRALSTAMGKEIPKLLEAIKDIPEVSKQIKFILSEPSRISNITSNKKYVDNKKVTDHHAIINTKQKPDLSKLTDKEKKLFIMVIKKFVSIFLDPQISNKTTIITDISGETFKTTGSVIIQDGFKELYKSDKNDTDEEENILPKVKEGETLNVKAINILSKKTQPPKPYTDSSLLEAMQNAGKFVEDDKMKEILNDTKGLGTSATRAGIIDELINKDFAMRKGKTIRATEFGFEAIKSLDGKDIISPILTAKWEERLQDIEEGNLTNSQFNKDMNQFIINETSSFLTTLSPLATGNPNRKVIGKCPICGLNVVATSKYYLCEGYKKEESTNCSFVCGKIVSEKAISEADMQKILDGKETKTMKFKNADKKTFDAALKFNPETKKIQFVFTTGNEICVCPKCGDKIIDKGGSYGCNNKDCNFFIAKSLKGTSITTTDVKNLVTGKATASKKFFSGKNPWYAKLKYNEDFSKLEFIFDTKSK